MLVFPGNMSLASCNVLRGEYHTCTWNQAKRLVKVFRSTSIYWKLPPCFISCVVSV